MAGDTQPFQSNNPVVKWVEYRLPIISLLHQHLVVYPSPKNFNYWYNFGSILGIMLVVQIITGIVLAIGFLLWGARTQQRSWRVGSLVLMLAAISIHSRQGKPT